MQLLLNGKNTDYDGPANLKALVQSLSLNTEAIVVELNESIAKREQYADQLLQDGDKVEIVHFVGGG